MFRTARKTTRPRRPLTLLAAAVVSGSGLAACTIDTTPGPRVSQDPYVFYASLAPDEDLTGVYNPAGFSSADVQKGLAQICGNRRITEYAEQPAGDMMAFSGHCWGGTGVLTGTISFRRMGNRLRIEVPGYIDRDQNRDSHHWSILL